MTTCGLLRTRVITELSSHPQATTVCFNWYFQQSAIISFKSVKRFRLYNEDCLCLLWGMNCVFIYRRNRGKDLWKPWRHCGVEAQLHPFLTSALYWDERSASYLNFFTCWIHGSHWIGSCAELRLSQGSEEDTKPLPMPGYETTFPGRPIRCLVTIRTETSLCYLD
jgi:hypothetical protein